MIVNSFQFDCQHPSLSHLESKMCKLCDASEIHRLIRSGAALSAIKQQVVESNFSAVNERSPCGKSPLMTAGYFCRKDIIEYLVEKGAVVNALDEKTGDTAAHYITLSLSGHIKQCACLMALVESGADIDLRNRDGYSVYELAEKNGNHDIGSTGNMMRAE